MRDPDQITKYNKQEMGLIKSLFAENQDLLFLIRKVMFQEPMTPEETAALRGAMTEPVLGIMRKAFQPDLDMDAPLGQLSHMLLGLGTDIRGLSPDGAWPFIKAKEIEINYIEQQVSLLAGSQENPKILFKDFQTLEGTKPTRETVYIKQIVWNFLLNYIEQQLVLLRILAGKTEETVEETMERVKKNSNK